MAKPSDAAIACRKSHGFSRGKMLAERVTLECPKCGKTKEANRDKTDPPSAARVRVACPECNGGDFGLIDYFDADGKQVYPD